MIRCALVDDEPMALEILQDHVARIPFLEEAGAYRNALQALEALPRLSVDLVFLDINMPDLSGLQFLRALKEPPLVVFTTAYSTYAVESYDFEALDYLLKPIEFPRFLKAAQRARERLEGQRPAEAVFVKCGTDFHRVTLGELQYVESAGNYVVFATPTRKLLALMTMAEVQELLGSRDFVRVHRSFIVGLRHLEVVEAEGLKLSGRHIPIGDKYRSALKAVLKAD